MLNWLSYRIFEYYSKKNKSSAMSDTVNFMTLILGASIVPIVIIINLFIEFNPKAILGDNKNMKFYIGIPLAVVLLIINSYYLKRRLKGDGLAELKIKYHREKYRIPIWIIFSIPVFFVFICPIIYGIINGTLSFPFLEK